MHILYTKLARDQFLHRVNCHFLWVRNPELFFHQLNSLHDTLKSKENPVTFDL